MKKIIWIGIVVLICIITMLFSDLKNNNNKEMGVITKAIQITDFAIDGREVIKKGTAIYVGNNKKELENNFYDIKIDNVEGQVHVFLNKLWYERYDRDYIQDEYLAKICRELAIKLQIQTNLEQLEYAMYKYVKDNYMNIRNGNSVEAIDTDEYFLKLELENDIVKLIIRSES